MRKTIGLGLTLAAAGFFAIAPALAQTGSTSGSQSGTYGGQSGRRGSQSGTQQPGTSTSQSGSQAGQTSTTPSGQAGQSSTQAASGISSSDRQFLTKAAQGSMAEIEMGKLAQERGSSEHVKELGKQLAEDHQKSLDQIRTIAQNKGINLPQEISKKDKAEHDRLSALSGDAFDRAFLRSARQDHKRDIAEYKRQSERSTDPDVKQYAQSTLPVLERHQQMSMQESATASTTREGATTAPRTDTEESATAGSKQKEKSKEKNKDWSEERPKSSSSSSSSTNPR